MNPLLLFADNLSIFDPASPGASSIRNASVLVLAITGFIFIVVEGILFYAIYRFRADADGKEPPQVYGSKPIEIAWTAAPALIVFVLLMVTVRTIWEVNPTPPSPQQGDQTLFVTAIGHQWWWEYHYDYYDGRKLGLVTANELHIPAGAGGVPRPVYLTLLSADVCHSYWVPRLAGKTDMIPGRTNHMWIQTDQPKLYLGQCAEFCGSQHANMLIRVVAEPAEKFDSWLANQEKEQKPRDKEPRDGQPRPNGLPPAVVRELPPSGRHRRPRHLCSGFDSPHEPPDTRRRDDRQHARQPPPMDSRPAEDQTELPDAVIRPE